jgi:hypothetical protein
VTVTLPHYYFSVGWRATLDNEPIALAPGRDGLIAVTVPHGGLLDVRFTMTPMRRLGVFMSAIVLLSVLAHIALGRDRSQIRDIERGMETADPAPSPGP